MPRRTPPRSHNGGPPLDDEPLDFEWGKGPAGVYFLWKNAHRRAWRNPSRGIVLRRLENAEALGLTYDEYTLELLERGRHLSAEDAERVAAIKADRPSRRGRRHA